jgi:hypothetical protein
MNARPLAIAVGISLLLVLPVLTIRPVAAVSSNGLYAAFWKNSFFGGPLAAFPACTQETSAPAGVVSSTLPTATEIDPNIAHGTSTGFLWHESGSGFTVGSTVFHNTVFSVEWTGYISLNTGTTYYFQLQSDDGSWLYINTTPGSSTISAANLKINDANPTNSNGQGDGIQPPTAATSAGVTVPSSGLYPIEVDYYETCDTQSGIDLSWSTTSSTGPFTIIPSAAFTPAQIGSNAFGTFPPPNRVPEFGFAAPVVAALGLLAMVIMRKTAFGRTDTTV